MAHVGPEEGQTAVEFRKLGRTGLDVSAIGLGTEHLERQEEGANIGTNSSKRGDRQ